MPFNRDKRSANDQLVLTEREEAYGFAAILTDGTINIEKNANNPRIGISQSIDKVTLLRHWMDVMSKYFTEDQLAKVWDKSRMRKKKSPKSDSYGYHYEVKTKNCKTFYVYIDEFNIINGLSSSKNIPSLSYLKKVINWESLALILMFDGSHKTNEISASKAIEVHLQNSSYKGQSRFCIALYEKLNVRAWPSKYTPSSKDKLATRDIQQYHVQISGYSLPLIRENCLPYFIKEEIFLQKIPSPHKRLVVESSQSPWRDWYEKTKNKPWLEKVSPRHIEGEGED